LPVVRDGSVSFSITEITAVRLSLTNWHHHQRGGARRYRPPRCPIDVVADRIPRHTSRAAPAVCRSAVESSVPQHL
jgi:hypothetical protein